MRKLFAVVLTFAFATVAGAQEAPLSDVNSSADAAVVEAPVAATPVANVVSAPSQDVSADTEMRVVTERANDVQDAAAMPTQRGSFWWYVAILVVAAVIVAVVL